MDQKQTISIRAFAKIVGMSDTAINKMRTAKRITEVCETVNPKNGRPELFLSLAILDFENSTGKKVSEKKIQKFLDSLKPKSETETKKVAEAKKEKPIPAPSEKKVVPAIAPAEKKTAKAKSKLLDAEPELVKKKTAEEIPPEPKYEEIILEEKTKLSISRPEAERRSSIFKAEKERYELMEKRGELVNKKQVYAELFDIGQELKTNLLSLPDKIIDNILACTDRNEAYLILTKALTECLISLEGIDEK